MRTTPRSVPAGLEIADSNLGFITDPRRFPYFRSKGRNLTRAKRNRLVTQSPFSESSALWATLSSAEKDAWNTAGTYCGLSGWSLFNQDLIWRNRFAMSVPGTPNNLHQLLTLFTRCDYPPSDSVVWWQGRRLQYYKYQAISGSTQRELVFVNEPVPTHLKMSINYKTDIIARASNPWISLGFRVEVNPGSGSCFVDYNTLVPPSATWTTFEFETDIPLGNVIGYRISCASYGYRGDYWWDNLSVYHDSMEWAFDPHMENSFIPAYRDMYGVDHPAIDQPTSSAYSWIFGLYGDYDY
ncbi:hypothetical protein GW916_14095 [bacterium]|nr:hypothetical protein [bacterium]